MKTVDIRLEKENSVSAEQNAGNASLIVSVAILALVLAISSFLFFANRSTVNEIEGLRKTSAAYDASIAKLKSNRNIAAAENIRSNEIELARNIRSSEAQKYIAEVRNISKTFKIDFSGFSYQDGKVSTSAVAASDSVAPNEDAIGKVSKLVQFFRTSTGSVFELSPVVSVSGPEQRRSF